MTRKSNGSVTVCILIFTAFFIFLSALPDRHPLSFLSFFRYSAAYNLHETPLAGILLIKRTQEEDIAIGTIISSLQSDRLTKRFGTGNSRQTWTLPKRKKTADRFLLARSFVFPVQKKSCLHFSVIALWSRLPVSGPAAISYCGMDYPLIRQRVLPVCSLSELRSEGLSAAF